MHLDCPLRRGCRPAGTSRFRKMAQMEAVACPLDEHADAAMHGCHARHRQASMCACREAQVEQRIARREAAKEREQSPELLKLPGGGDIMGGDDSLSFAKARYTCC